MLALERTDIRGSDIRWRVAVAARGLCMTSLECVACLGVIEGCGVQTDLLKVDALVIRVTLGAIFFGHRGMVALLLTQTVAKRRMALQAPSLGDAGASEFMTLGAIANAFQLSMWLRELAWREHLGVDRLY